MKSPESPQPINFSQERQERLNGIKEAVGEAWLDFLPLQMDGNIIMHEDSSPSKVSFYFINDELQATDPAVVVDFANYLISKNLPALTGYYAETEGNNDPFTYLILKKHPHV